MLPKRGNSRTMHFTAVQILLLKMEIPFQTCCEGFFILRQNLMYMYHPTDQKQIRYFPSGRHWDWLTFVRSSFIRDGIMLLVHISSNALTMSNFGNTLKTSKHNPNVWAASNMKTWNILIKSFHHKCILLLHDTYWSPIGTAPPPQYLERGREYCFAPPPIFGTGFAKCMV